MKKKRYAEEQIDYALHQADNGLPIGHIVRKLGVSQATFYAWKRKYSGLGVVEIRRLKQLDEENRKLK